MYVVLRQGLVSFPVQSNGKLSGRVHEHDIVGNLRHAGGSVVGDVVAVVQFGDGGRDPLDAKGNGRT